MGMAILNSFPIVVNTSIPITNGRKNSLISHTINVVPKNAPVVGKQKKKEPFY